MLGKLTVRLEPIITLMALIPLLIVGNVLLATFAQQMRQTLQKKFSLAQLVHIALQAQQPEHFVRLASIVQRVQICRSPALVATIVTNWENHLPLAQVSALQATTATWLKI